MMTLSRFFTLLILGAFVAGSSYAAVVTVPGNAATINGALELLDYNDGEADVVLIGPGVYDEQVAPKANAGADSVAFPSAGGLSTPLMQQAVQSHPDPLTLRGSDPNDPPVLTLIGATPAPYGVFPGNPSDFFFSIFVYCSKDITCENINLQYGPTQDYAKNGMASNFVWNDCIFSHGAVGTGEDFCDYNNNFAINSDQDPLIGLDNEYIYSNCIIDGSSTVDGSRFDTSFVWWNGYGNNDRAAATGSGVTFDNCVIRYWDDLIHQFRASSPTVGNLGDGLGPVVMEDCFLYSPSVVFRTQGAHSGFTIIRNVLDQANDHFIRVDQRNGRRFSEDLIFANNITYDDGGGQRIIRINEGAEASGVIQVVNNTFLENTNNSGLVNLRAPGNGAICNISNNIIDASVVSPVPNAVAILIEDAAWTVNVNNNVIFDVASIYGAGSLPDTDVGNSTTPVTYVSQVINIPSTPPTTVQEREQGYVPANGSSAQDAGSNASYAAISAAAGNVDVDSLNARTGGATIDIGAQESNGASLVPGWDMY